jgi:hypothetical protein
MAKAAAASTTRRDVLHLAAAAAAAAVPVGALAAEADTVTGALKAAYRPAFLAMSPQELATVYGCLATATDAWSGAYNQPRVHWYPQATEFVDDELERVRILAEQIVDIARHEWPEGERAEEYRLDVLREFSSRVDDPDLDAELAAALIAYRANT